MGQIEALYEKIAASFPPGQVKLVGDVIEILKGKILVKLSGVEREGPTSEHVRKIYNSFFNISSPKTRQVGQVQCPHCQKILKNQGGLTNHLRKDHPEDFLRLIDDQERDRNVYIANPKASKEDREKNGHWVKYLAGMRKFDFCLSRKDISSAMAQLKTYISEYFLSLDLRPNPTLDQLPYAKSNAHVLQILVDRARDKLVKSFKEQGIPTEIIGTLANIASEQEKNI